MVNSFKPSPEGIFPIYLLLVELLALTEHYQTTHKKIKSKQCLGKENQNETKSVSADNPSKRGINAVTQQHALQLWVFKWQVVLILSGFLCGGQGRDKG